MSRKKTTITRKHKCRSRVRSNEPPRCSRLPSILSFPRFYFFFFLGTSDNKTGAIESHHIHSRHSSDNLAATYHHDRTFVFSSWTGLRKPTLWYTRIGVYLRFVSFRFAVTHQHVSKKPIFWIASRHFFCPLSQPNKT